MHRVDQALTNNTLGVGVSSFRIDWTYENGVGEALDFAGVPYAGVVVSTAHEQPWFGLNDPDKSVFNYGDNNSPAITSGILTWATTIYADNIEQTPTSIPPLPAPPSGVVDYWAVFGYNQTMPFHDLSVDPDGAGTQFTGGPIRSYAPGIGREPTSANSNQIGYTPWPSAIRVTMVLNDPDGKLEGGREFQFVIRLPQRVP
jgi:hypothetical protein